MSLLSIALLSFYLSLIVRYIKLL